MREDHATDKDQKTTRRQVCQSAVRNDRQQRLITSQQARLPRGLDTNNHTHNKPEVSTSPLRTLYSSIYTLY